MISPSDILILDIKKIANFEKVVRKFVFRDFGRFGGVSLCLFIDPYRFSLLCYRMYAVLTSNIKWLLIVDGVFFLFLSCQHPGNFVPTDHPDHQKKLLRFGPENPWHSQMLDSTLKSHDAAINREWPWKPTAQRCWYIWCRANILSIFFGTDNRPIRSIIIFKIWCCN